MPSSQTRPGTIDKETVYTLAEFRSRTSMTVSAKRAARRRGLKVHRLGKRGYILGSDFIRFLEEIQTDYVT